MSMKGINGYHKQISEDQIKRKSHRDFVGGFWEELGQLQFDFLIERGLKPDSFLLDVGCGCLRGGVYFLKYLDANRYFGLDINESLITAGLREIEEAGLVEKHATLIVDDNFLMEKLGCEFDYMIAVSLFTHLPMNMIIRCLSNARKCLAATGVFYATFFEAPSAAYLSEVRHEPGGVTTKYDSDPFHYSDEELVFMASVSGLKVDVVGDWGHPRNQKMVKFYI